MFSKNCAKSNKNQKDGTPCTFFRNSKDPLCKFTINTPPGFSTTVQLWSRTHSVVLRFETFETVSRFEIWVFRDFKIIFNILSRSSVVISTLVHFAEMLSFQAQTYSVLICRNFFLWQKKEIKIKCILVFSGLDFVLSTSNRPSRRSFTNVSKVI